MSSLQPDQDIARLLALSDERDAQLQQRLRLDAYEFGYLDGIEAGRRQALAEEGIARRAMAGRVHGARPGTKYAAFTEVEALRWGPGGREHFADPRPGDYPGQDAA